MAAERVHCPEPGCDDNAGEGFANGVALRGHRLGKHTIAEPCPICGKPYKDLAQHTDRAHPSEAGDREPPPNGDAGGPVAGPESEPAEFAERMPSAPSGMGGPPPEAPRAKVRRWREKVWGGEGKDEPATPNGNAGDTAYGPREKAPRSRTSPRSDASPLLQLFWGGIGNGLVRFGIDVPVGRVLQFQAPAAGNVLDTWLAKGRLDRWVLQPLASRTDDAEALGALFGLPIAIFLMERSSEPMSLYPMVRAIIESNLVNMAPVVKKQQADAKKMKAVLEDLGMNIPEGADPIGFIMDQIFAPPPGAPAPPPGPADEPAPV